MASAKSWLCHAGVDRTAELLPWHAAPDVDRLSPIEASARYLRHMREAWDASHPQQPLAQQDVVLTLPASFDEVAREMTVQAAALAGLPRVILIEEPQAAFYAWVYKHRDRWESLVAPGQKILVCDVGGGTSDFTLIRVRAAARDETSSGTVQFHRIAVGEHLILGGDNLDLALAKYLEHTLGEQAALEPRQWDVLVRSCRQAKETLLGEQPPEQLTINLPAVGTRLIGGSLRIQVTREAAERELVDGFFPRVELTDRPHATPFGLSGIRPAVCGRPRRHAVPGRLSGGAPRGGPGCDRRGPRSRRRASGSGAAQRRRVRFARHPPAPAAEHCRLVW